MGAVLEIRGRRLVNIFFANFPQAAKEHLRK